MLVSPTQTVPLGPWRGVNNVEDEVSSAYQIGEQLAYLREAVNFDLHKEGWLSRRVGRTKLLTLTSGHSIVAADGMLLLADNGSLKRVYPASTAAGTLAVTLVSGLSGNPVSFAEAGGQIYWCDSQAKGRVSVGASTFWGLEPPGPPTLTATTGNLPAGQYMVALTCESASGVESGARPPTVISLPTGGGIAVSGITHDAYAAYVNVYVSSTNGRDVFWADRVAATVTTYTVASMAESADPLTSIGMFGPPVGAHRVASHGGWLLVAAGSTLYWSQPLAYHLFRLATDVQLFADEIVLLESSDGGFYVAEGEQTWWVGGDDPETWSPRVVDTSRVSAGTALRIPGSKIPALETAALVLVWMTEAGPVAGLPEGRIVHLTENMVSIPYGARASLAYREERGLAQVLMQLQQPAEASGFATSDRCTADVVKSYDV